MYNLNMTWNSANGYIFAKELSTRIYVCCKIDIAIFIWKHNPHLLAFVSSSHIKWMLTIVLIASDNHMFSNQIELFGLINRHRAYYPSCMSSYLFCEKKAFSGNADISNKDFLLYEPHLTCTKYLTCCWRLELIMFDSKSIFKPNLYCLS